MERCNPTVTRDNMRIARTMSDNGIDFVCVPVTSEKEKSHLIKVAQSKLGEMIEEAEKKETNSKDK